MGEQRRPFPNTDEFTSARIRKSVDRQGKLEKALGVTEAETLRHKLDILGNTDPYDVAVEQAGGIEPTASQEMAAVSQRAMLQQACLERLGDLHRGMHIAEVHDFFVKAQFQLAYAEGEPDQSKRFEIWCLRNLGVVVAGAPSSSGHHHYTMFLQWSPNRPRMNETEEASLNVRMRSVFCGNFSGGYFNPRRPTLDHGRLHYPSSYPECTEEEAERWRRAPYTAPEWAETERGGWIMAIESFVASGVLSPIIGLQHSNGKFITPWESGVEAKLMVEAMLGKFGEEGRMERRLAGLAPWFKPMIENALIDPQQAQDLLNARNNVVSIKSHGQKPEV